MRRGTSDGHGAILHAVWVGLVVAATSCTPADETAPPSLREAPRVAEAADSVASLTGRTLEPVPLPSEVRADREEKLRAARAAFEAAPDDPEAAIWLGRRLAYLGRYREAVEVFDRGFERHPDDARFLRHRGHRMITLRRLERAESDLERAAELMAGTPDEVEPDGLPNARGIPTSTLHGNVWYHLGLARYLQGDFEGALEAYRRCLDVSGNADMLVATSHWLYMTLRRLGREEEAAVVLEPITADLDVIENGDYLRLLLLYRGELGVDDLLDPAADGISSATVGYGVGNWHLYDGRPDEAAAVFERVLEGEQWAAFGYLAAESEMSRPGAAGRP